MISLVTVAEATVPTFIKLVPVGDPSLNSTVPAAASFTMYAPFNLIRPAKITSAALLFIPAETFPAAAPLAAICVTVLK